MVDDIQIRLDSCLRDPEGRLFIDCSKDDCGINAMIVY
jgi:hypothetical protein